MRTIYPDVEFNRRIPGVAGTLSIGIVDEEDREFYAINADADLEALAHPDLQWLVLNVAPYLPVWIGEKDGLLRLEWDTSSPDYQYVKPATLIAADLEAWLAEDSEGGVRAYGWYGCRDLCRIHDLWGDDWDAMPDAMPRYYTGEIRAMYDELGVKPPPHPGGEHQALVDAYHHRGMRRYASKLLAERAGTLTAGTR